MEQKDLKDDSLIIENSETVVAPHEEIEVDMPEVEEVCQTAEISAEQQENIEVESVVPEACPTVDAAYIATLFEKLSEKYDKKIAVDEHKNKLFDKMYAELESYKKDIHSKLIKPFIMETIMLIEDMSRFIDKMENCEPEKIAKYLKSIPDDLTNLLEVSGVELYEEENDTFSTKTQRAVKQIETDKAELNNKIESRQRKGYTWDGIIIRPEAVQIYKYKEVEN